jgi:hypothetical protein
MTIFGTMSIRNSKKFFFNLNLRITEIRRTTDNIKEMKKNFHTPNFSSQDMKKISPINVKEENLERAEENFLTCKN